MKDLSIKYMGLSLRSPIIAASSGLTIQTDRVKSFERAGVGAVVLKSLFEEQIVNEVEFISSSSSDYPESADYLYHYIRQNSIERYLEQIRSIKSSVAVPIIASINCYSGGEWVNFAKEVEGAGADGIELNIYSLPISIDRSSVDIEKEYLSVVSKIAGSVKIPVAVKIADTYTNIPGFISNLQSNGAKGAILFNRFFTPDIDINQMKIVAAEAFSRENDYIKELRWIGIVSSMVRGVDLSASTGVHSGETAIKLLLSGATTVQLCSILYKRGADIITDISKEISSFMDSHGYSTISDFRGKLNYKNIEHPEKFERVQFMKAFGGR